MDWDYQLFKWINDAAENESVPGKLLVYAADLGDYFFAFSLILMLAFRWKMAVYGFMSVGATVLFSRSIALFYFRERPFVSHDVNLLLPHMESGSFPSDHAAAAFAIAAMFFLFSRRIGLLFAGCAAIVAFSRIWVGKHYPLDVIAGAIIGIGIAIGVFRIIEKYQLYDRFVSRFKSFVKKA